MAGQQRRVERVAQIAQRDHFVALLAPAGEQALQCVAELEPFQFGMKREHVVLCRFRRNAQQVLVHVFRCQVVNADQFIEGGERGRQLRAGDDLGIPHRDKRVAAAAVRCPAISQALGHAQGMGIHLPAGGAVAGRIRAENLREALVCSAHLTFGPGRVGVLHAVLPLHVIPAVDRGFEAGIARRAQDIGAAPADIRPRQQRAVHQGLDPIVRHHGGALHLFHEAGAEHALDGASGVIGAEREQKARTGAMAAQDFHQPGNALQRAAPGIDIDFQCQLRHEAQSISLRASATSVR